MSRPIKFRYANEIAGAFVIIALLLFVGGIFMAGQSQGWFEGKFDLIVEFVTPEGSFGLQEGGEVWVMNTVAGRVTRIVPTGEGGMQGELVLQNRYLPFIRVDSVARVKRKFGLAGDAYVEIQAGKGDAIVDGAVIPGVKDEEIMDTARKMLENLETDVLPMIEDSREILSHINTITAAIAEGEGVAGAALHDKEITDDVKQMLDGVNALIIESEDAIQETTRLIKGVQKHWLIRKHIEDPTPEIVLSISQIDASLRDRSARAWSEGAEAGRIANSPEHVAVNALNMGYVCLDANQLDECEAWLAEARFEVGAAGLDPARVALLEAELAQQRGRSDLALDLLTAGPGPGKGASRALRAAWLILEGRARLAAGQVGEAREAHRLATREAKKADSECLRADAAALAGEIALVEKQGGPAAVAFDRAAAHYRAASLYGAMSRALARAGTLYESKGKNEQAFDRFYRASRSRIISGCDGADYLANARRIGNNMQDSQLVAQVERLQKLVSTPH
ncbi:MAG: hypothetical protein QGH42_04370 [Kiritimatiellia bacterium]|jgi:phospholipid/cholesterol/gamma-HCH transport system substrate-binding protein|nr:hypothetical protein [Kiritimatiellia bacterium]MDP6631347.1 hypothetical protein [Kiritimatiellia bacterium]MDP6809679.1 hypothetical protein [Kiritimatiellia bacterium]MDP7023471.1 hypothetical protein [Kiritimatiellia bacterium]